MSERQAYSTGTGTCTINFTRHADYRAMPSRKAFQIIRHSQCCTWRMRISTSTTLSFGVPSVPCGGRHSACAKASEQMHVDLGKEYVVHSLALNQCVPSLIILSALVAHPALHRKSRMPCGRHKQSAEISSLWPLQTMQVVRQQGSVACLGRLCLPLAAAGLLRPAATLPCYLPPCISSMPY